MMGFLRDDVTNARNKYFNIPINPRGSRVLPISSDGDDRMIFWGLKFLIPGFF